MKINGNDISEKEYNKKILELKQKIKEYWICDNGSLTELLDLKAELDLDIKEFDRMFMFYRPNYRG